MIVEKINKKLTIPLSKAIKNVSFVTPDLLTITSFVAAGIIAPYLILKNSLTGAALFFYLGAILDSLDGDLARARGITSERGALLDAVLDRYTDLLVISAMIINRKDLLIWGLLAMIGVSLVPYIRAKGEALGKPPVPTFGSRDIRCAIITAGLLLKNVEVTLVVLAIISNLSAFHRLFKTLQETEK